MLPVDPPQSIKERALNLRKDPKNKRLIEWDGSIIDGRHNANVMTDPLPRWKAEFRYQGLIDWQNKFEQITRGLTTQQHLTFHPAGKVSHLDQSFDWFEKKNWLQPPAKKEKPCPGFLRLDRLKEKTSGSIYPEWQEPHLGASTLKLAKSLSLNRLIPSDLLVEESGVPSVQMVGQLKQSSSTPSLSTTYMSGTASSLKLP
jgi:hypothetical protein